jgi:hypothetical protein
MGMLSNMRDMINAAPGLIESANQLAASAEAQSAAAQASAAMPGTMGSQGAVNAVNQQAYGEPDAAQLESIAGVDLEAYARVSKGIAAFGFDTSKFVDVAAGLGISATDWQTAQDGWGARIQSDRAVGSRFNQIYTAL